MLCVPGQGDDGESVLGRVVGAHAVVDVYPLLGAPGGGGEVGVGVERGGRQSAVELLVPVVYHDGHLL